MRLIGERTCRGCGCSDVRHADGAVTAAVKQAVLSRAVLAATTTCPRIVAAAARAAHGPPAGRLEQLRLARRLVTELGLHLELVEFELTGRKADQ
jgi:hypothetical protein